MTSQVVMDLPSGVMLDLAGGRITPDPGKTV